MFSQPIDVGAICNTLVGMSSRDSYIVAFSTMNNGNLTYTHTVSNVNLDTNGTIEAAGPINDWIRKLAGTAIHPDFLFAFDCTGFKEMPEHALGLSKEYPHMLVVTLRAEYRTMLNGVRRQFVIGLARDQHTAVLFKSVYGNDSGNLPEKLSIPK